MKKYGRRFHFMKRFMNRLSMFWTYQERRVYPGWILAVEREKCMKQPEKEYPYRNLFLQMPWITYTHISHTNSGKKDNATPLFDWGKYDEKDGKIVMPVSVQAHHSFVDGIHIGQFADMLQKYLESF